MTANLIIALLAGRPVEHVHGLNNRVLAEFTFDVQQSLLHGLFDDDAFRRAWLDHVRQDVGLKPQGRQLVRCDLEASLDRLADVVRQNVDMKAIYKRLGL